LFQPLIALIAPEHEAPFVEQFSLSIGDGDDEKKRKKTLNDY
jgi:hypothetical protein